MKSDILAPIKFSHQLWLKESGAHLWLMDVVHGHLSSGLGPRGRHDKASLIKNWTPNCSRCCFCSVLMCVRDYLCWWAVWCVCEGDLCSYRPVHLHHAAQVYLLRDLEHAGMQRHWQQVSLCSINVNTIWTCILWWNIQISLLLSWQWWRFMHKISFEPA